MKALITGCNGLVGSHLARHLLSERTKVAGTYHINLDNLEDIAARMALFPCDLCDPTRVEKILDRDRPSVIFHFAAQSYPLGSWKDPAGTFRTNCIGTIHLLEGTRKLKTHCTILAMGSSSEYRARQAASEPINEETPLEPTSPYGVSKLAVDLMGLMYARAHQMRVVRVRPFFIIGPGFGSNVTIDFARSITQIESGASKELRVGNLAAVRDFLDVRDAVRALVILAEKGVPGEVYNLSSGRGHKIQDVLDSMVAMATVPITVIGDPDKFRPLDAPVIIGDNERLRALGWEPQIPFEKTLADVLEFWRRQVGQFPDSPCDPGKKSYANLAQGLRKSRRRAGLGLTPEPALLRADETERRID